MAYLKPRSAVIFGLDRVLDVLGLGRIGFCVSPDEKLLRGNTDKRNHGQTGIQPDQADLISEIDIGQSEANLNGICRIRLGTGQNAKLLGVLSRCLDDRARNGQGRRRAT